ncbi:MAG TPA: hypothetical protein VEI29_07660, partial [Burkholderiaceae bacterium]|nr:hypothetical protein [Burkholderiaceae bacterium]
MRNFRPNWNRAQLGAGFSSDEQALIDALAPRGQSIMDACLRIASPIVQAKTPFVIPQSSVRSLFPAHVRRKHPL